MESGRQRFFIVLVMRGVFWGRGFGDQSVTCTGVLEPEDDTDVAGLDGGDVDSIVSIHPEETLGAFFGLEVGIEEVGGADESA